MWLCSISLLPSLTHLCDRHSVVGTEFRFQTLISHRHFASSLWVYCRLSVMFCLYKMQSIALELLAESRVRAMDIHSIVGIFESTI